MKVYDSHGVLWTGIDTITERAEFIVYINADFRRCNADSRGYLRRSAFDLRISAFKMSAWFIMVSLKRSYGQNRYAE